MWMRVSREGGGNWLRGGVGGRIKVDRGLTKFVLESK